MNKIIEFKNVDKYYNNKTVHALKKINLDIYEGEIVAIIGLSGSGKSTLLRTINKMHDIQDGELTVNGTDVQKLQGKNLMEFRHGIGMVFQSFNLIERTTVIKNVLVSKSYDKNIFSAFLGKYTYSDKKLALESLQRVNLLEKAYVRVDQLSGGQRQRVALARVLTQDPKIILADEPVAALDPVTATKIMKDFQNINKELGITILLNMHHVDLALNYAQRVIGINDGVIVYDGPTSDVDEEVLAKIYGDKLSEKDFMEQNV